MQQTRDILHHLPESERTSEYNNILQHMSNFIHCNHDIVKDYIDITPDRSDTIYYCANCMETMTIEKIYDELNNQITKCKVENQDVLYIKGNMKLHIQNIILLRSKICISCCRTPTTDASVCVQFNFGLNEIKNYDICDNVLSVRG